MSKIILEFMKDVNYQVDEDKLRKRMFTSLTKLRDYMILDYKT